MGEAEPPAASISSTTAWQSARRRLETMVCAPCAASSLAMAAPMPRLAPLTTAILPVRSNRLDAAMSVALVESAVGNQVSIAGPVQMRRGVVTDQIVALRLDGNLGHRGVDQRPAECECLLARRMQQRVDDDGDGTSGGECPDRAGAVPTEPLQTGKHRGAEAVPCAGVFAVEIAAHPALQRGGNDLLERSTRI